MLKVLSTNALFPHQDDHIDQGGHVIRTAYERCLQSALLRTAKHSGVGYAKSPFMHTSTLV